MASATLALIKLSNTPETNFAPPVKICNNTVIKLIKSWKSSPAHPLERLKYLICSKLPHRWCGALQRVVGWWPGRLRGWKLLLSDFLTHWEKKCAPCLKEQRQSSGRAAAPTTAAKTTRQSSLTCLSSSVIHLNKNILHLCVSVNGFCSPLKEVFLPEGPHWRSERRSVTAALLHALGQRFN